MFERVRRTEWPLVVFTLGTQVAGGLAIAAAACDLVMPFNATVHLLGMAIAPVVAASTAASLLHLGRPSRSWRAVTNLRHSPLSREVLASGIFLLLAILYSSAFWIDVSQGRAALGVITGIWGVAAVVFGARVYRIPTQPVWQSWTLPVSFIGTAVLFAAIAGRVALGGSDAFLARGASATIIIAGAVLIVCALLTRSPRTAARVPGFAPDVSICAYCAVLSVTIALAGIPASTASHIHATLFVVLIVASAMQRSTLLHGNRIPQF